MHWTLILADSSVIATPCAEVMDKVGPLAEGS